MVDKTKAPAKWQEKQWRTQETLSRLHYQDFIILDVKGED